MVNRRRVLEMMESSVKVMLGSDNIADVFIPSGTPNLYTEVEFLSNAVRFYNPKIWAKVLAGIDLNDMDRVLIGRSLEQDREVNDRIRKERA